MKHPYYVRLGEVRFLRNGETLQVHYPEADIPIYNVHLGPELAGMSEQDVVDAGNEHLRAMAQRAGGYKHVAIEVRTSKPPKSTVRTEIWHWHSGWMEK